MKKIFASIALVILFISFFGACKYHAVEKPCGCNNNHALNFDSTVSCNAGTCFFFSDSISKKYTGNLHYTYQTPSSGGAQDYAQDITIQKISDDSVRIHCINIPQPVHTAFPHMYLGNLFTNFNYGEYHETIEYFPADSITLSGSWGDGCYTFYHATFAGRKH